ncbi:MAG: nitroreductase [Desulfuromonas sp.]|nr:MAG: nitroreductase [Desulfuromonas sp.]
MIPQIPNERVPEVEVDAIFTDRWSPRAFSDEPLSEEQIATLFEAARWAPSCFNDQPWHFRYAVSSDDRARFSEALVEKNQQWAQHAPMLVFVLARKHFSKSEKPNRHAVFDAGAAWMSLALQARRLGLYAHGMAGFSVNKAAEVLNVSLDEYEIMAAVAVGRRDDPSKLSDDQRANEKPNGRKPSAEVAGEGSF